MDYESCLKELLLPLGVYRMEAGSFQEAELAALGAAMDQLGRLLEECQRELLVPTAEGWGLDRRESLLSRKSAAPNLELRREALCAMLQIGGDSFTPADIQRTILGCGIAAEAREGVEPQSVWISFPGTAGEPERFDRIRSILEDILPCHLHIEYDFHYITWRRLEERFVSWAALESGAASWDALEKSL